MPELPVLRWEDVCRALESIGFFRKSQRGSHLKLRHADGRTVIVPVHYRDIPTGTLRSILRQAQMAPEDFIALVK
jgi:predicted RNA binding protein YcfA (HicA-like mRNA interferase family)